MTYFSDRELGERPQIIEEIGEAAWGGIQALLLSKIRDGSFGATYPVICPDGGVTGTDERAVSSAMLGEIPALPNRPWGLGSIEQPETICILDMVEFSWRSVGEPGQYAYHKFPKHYHLEFDRDQGRERFCDEINRIFSRNGLAYTLTAEGRVERLGPPVLSEELASTHFQSGEDELDRLLETARTKFLSPKEEIRREALLELWDAWERLKTTGEGSDKKKQITFLLDCAADPLSPQFRQHIEKDANELTTIGNNLQIRHSEVSKEKVQQSAHIDYLFHRLFSMIQLILKTKGT